MSGIIIYSNESIKMTVKEKNIVNEQKTGVGVIHRTTVIQNNEI